MSQAEKISFRMISFMHETLYGMFRDPNKALNAAGLEPGQRVLEVGCGPGFFTVPAARMVGDAGSILAVDINPVAVAHVREKIEGAGASNAEAVLANADQMDLPDQSFDLIFLFGLGHPRGDMNRMWSELHRLLKPEGTLSIEGKLKAPPDLFRSVRRERRITRFARTG